jgi:putative addiction module component (TIGR02574 family)
MSHTAENLLETVLSLPEAERAAIAEALLSSLAEEPHELDDAEFARELERRSDEMKNDPDASISWSELKKLR